ncbi:MAG: DUF1579 family protein [Bacteroidota bacterium]
MKKIMILSIFVGCCFIANAQNSSCSDTTYRKFDFWLGEWDVFGPKGKKAGDSKISAILDSCVILEEWTSTGTTNGVQFQGKSFNTYNAATKQWQQTWVDNIGGSNEYLLGQADHKKIVFTTTPFQFAKDTMAVRRLSFFDLDKNKVRQLGEISKDSQSTWTIEYDLEYRRKIK